MKAARLLKTLRRVCAHLYIHAIKTATSIRAIVRKNGWSWNYESI